MVTSWLLFLIVLLAKQMLQRKNRQKRKAEREESAINGEIR